MINKKIYKYSNVELLDIIKNSTDGYLISKAKTEFESRNLSPEQKSKVESEYLKYKEFQRKRKDQPLTNEEWFTFFILPLFTPKPRWRNDHFSESEMERFQNFGFEKKIIQAKKARVFGRVFWFLIIIIGLLIVKIYR